MAEARPLSEADTWSHETDMGGVVSFVRNHLNFRRMIYVPKFDGSEGGVPELGELSRRRMTLVQFEDGKQDLIIQ